MAAFLYPALMRLIKTRIRLMAPEPYWRMWIAVGLLVILISWAYWPGLAGPFWFDDYGNLDILGAHGHIDHWSTLLYYLSSGQADPTGRPVALLSFLIDARDWPAAAWPFKRTNLVLHLLNTGLLAWVVARLQAAYQRRRPELPVSRWTPAMAAALWGAHPFFVSTTLYVVQREAMLPMTFVLLAMLAWDRTVSSFERQRPASGWAWALIGMGGATLLAGLSKANGFLAPLLVGLTYIYFLRPIAHPATPRRGHMDTAAIVCLLLPSLLMFGYLVYFGWQMWTLPQVPGRDWSLPQRLLSEPRAVWGYLWRLALPRAGGGGLYMDDFVASRGWLEPVTTMPAVIALIISIPAAIGLRHRFPIASFAWLFFLAAHLLESTTIPLELYFEHRNYLPAMFLGWPLANSLVRPGPYIRYRGFFAMSLLFAFVLLTHQRALVWGDPALMSELSASHQPASARSQVVAAGEEFDHGNPLAALQRIESAQRRDPGSVDIAITAIGVECHTTGSLSAKSLELAEHTLSNAQRWNYGLFEWLQNALRDPVTRNCHGFGTPGVRSLTAAIESNPRTLSVPGRLRDVAHVRGRIAIAEGDNESALRSFDEALRLKPDPEYALVQAAALGDAGAPALGVQHLDRFSRLDAARASEPVRDMYSFHLWLLRHYNYYPGQIASLRKELQSAAIQSPAHPGDNDKR